MTSTLNDKPLIGTIAGAFSGILYVVKALLTDDNILKWIVQGWVCILGWALLSLRFI